LIGISGSVPDLEEQLKFSVSEYAIHQMLALLVDRILDAGWAVVYGSQARVARTHGAR